MRTSSVAAILAALTIQTPFAADLTPSAIRALLEQQDAFAVVQSLDEPSRLSLLAHVEAGERGWIDLVPLLAPGADAAFTQSLAVTLSRALKANAAGVLGVLQSDHYSVGTICGDSGVEVSTIDAALVKVAAVMDPALFQVRNACLHELGAARISALT